MTPPDTAISTKKEIRLFVSSPSDVDDERRLVKKVIDGINETDGEKLGFHIKALTWEEGVTPTLTADNQLEIDSQIGDYAIYVGLMWQRFGRKTPRAGSGTEDEFNTALEKWNRDHNLQVLFYFSMAKSAVDLKYDEARWEQLGAAMRFRSRLLTLGIVGEYDDLAQLSLKLNTDLRKAVAKVLKAPQLRGPEGSREGPASGALRVFLPTAYKSMAWSRDGLVDGLKRAVGPPIEIDIESSPKDGFHQADLSIVLADKRVGPESLEQLDLASQGARRWILAVHPETDLTGNGADAYRTRLIALRDAPGDSNGQRNYRFIFRPSTQDSGVDVDEIVAEAVVLLKTIRRERASKGSKDLLLDGNPCDRRWLSLIDDYITEQHTGVSTKWTSERTLPRSYKGYDELFRDCLASLLVYGSIEEEWVQDRLDEVARSQAPDRLDKFVGVFYGRPPKTKKRFVNVRIGRAAYLPLYEIDSDENWKQQIDAFLQQAGLIDRAS